MIARGRATPSLYRTSLVGRLAATTECFCDSAEQKGTNSDVQLWYLLQCTDRTQPPDRKLWCTRDHHTPSTSSVEQAVAPPNFADDHACPRQILLDGSACQPPPIPSPQVLEFDDRPHGTCRGDRMRTGPQIAACNTVHDRQLKAEIRRGFQFYWLFQGSLERGCMLPNRKNERDSSPRPLAMPMRSISITTSTFKHRSETRMSE